MIGTIHSNSLFSNLSSISGRLSRCDNETQEREREHWDHMWFIICWIIFNKLWHTDFSSSAEYMLMSASIARRIFLAFSSFSINLFWLRFSFPWWCALVTSVCLFSRSTSDAAVGNSICIRSYSLSLYSKLLVAFVRQTREREKTGDDSSEWIKKRLMWI